jgi:hypothetical protein
MTAANITMMKLLKPVKPEDHITVACDRQRGSKTARGREREREREREKERERERERAESTINLQICVPNLGETFFAALRIFGCCPRSKARLLEHGCGLGHGDSKVVL